MAWPQRALLMGVVASALIVVTGAVPASLKASTASSVPLWGVIALNALLLLVLGPTTLVTTRRWFQHGLPNAQLRRQRRAVRRRALLLGLTAYVMHQALVVLLDPRFSLERLTGRRRAFSPVVAAADRTELAWAFTALAIGYIILAWLLWRSARVREVLSTAATAQPTGILEQQLSFPVAVQPAQTVEPLPRDPVTGRVIRQFDL